MATRTQERPAAVSTKTMKAVRIHDWGGVDTLRYEDAPRPVPGAGEVLVRVHAAAVNPVDWKIREGHLGKSHRLPLTLGWDLSGVVEELGDGVSGWSAGDEVFSRPDVMRDGAYAEYIVVKASELAARPMSITHVEAASIPLAGLTAWQALFDHGELQPGEKVLIHAASGGVGSHAVQLARWRGAHVVATASAKNHKYVISLGADSFIDYRTTRFEDLASDMDVVLDTIGGDTLLRSFQTLRKGGTLVSTVEEPPADKAAAMEVRGKTFMAQTRADELAQLAALVDSGHLRPAVETVLPLSEARRAHELSQSGHTRGKIVLKVV